MHIYTIYKAVCIKNSKCYIGYTSNLPVRIRRHFDAAYNKNSQRYNCIFSRAIRKYGKENFHWEVLYQSLDKVHTLTVMEPYFIKKYDSNNSGYNLSSGGEGPSGYKFTIDQRNNITGKNSPNYDQTIYTFINDDGRTFVGTRSDFELNHGYAQRRASSLVNKRTIQLNGWRIHFEEGFYYGKAKKTNEIIKLYHSDHGVFIGNRQNFEDTYGKPNSGNFSQLLLGKTNEVKGWRLIQEDHSVFDSGKLGIFGFNHNTYGNFIGTRMQLRAKFPYLRNDDISFITKDENIGKFRRKGWLSLGKNNIELTIDQ